MEFSKTGLSLGQYIGKNNPLGSDYSCYQFPDVIVGEDRVLNVYIPDFKLSSKWYSYPSYNYFPAKYGIKAPVKPIILDESKDVIREGVPAYLAFASLNNFTLATEKLFPQQALDTEGMCHLLAFQIERSGYNLVNRSTSYFFVHPVLRHDAGVSIHIGLTAHNSDDVVCVYWDKPIETQLDRVVRDSGSVKMMHLNYLWTIPLDLLGAPVRGAIYGVGSIFLYSAFLMGGGFN